MPVTLLTGTNWKTLNEAEIQSNKNSSYKLLFEKIVPQMIIQILGTLVRANSNACLLPFLYMFHKQC